MLAAHAWSARLLAHHGPACRAQALSLWSCGRGRLALVCDWMGNQRLHNLLHTHWPELAGALRRGRAVRLAPGIDALPVRTRRDGLLGVLIVVGALPLTETARALLDDLARRLVAALRAPLPDPNPEVLALPLALIDKPNGMAEAERRIWIAVLERHGGNVALAGRTLQVPRQTLAKRLRRLAVSAAGLRVVRAVPEALDLEDEALELERRTCLLLVQRYSGNLRLAAAAVNMTPSALHAYLRGLRIDVPPRPFRSTRRQQRDG